VKGRESFSLRVKRALDMVGAAAGLVVLSPLLAAIAVALRVTQGAPVLYRQTRPGLGGRPFTIVKFRTMRPTRDGEVWFRTDAERVTRLGKLLRTTSLDELPELWNVLVGDMSLVGPRPLLVEYLGVYTSREHRRHEVRPGITGWAAVNGRNALPFKERLELDVWYVEHRSLLLDLEILALTLHRVVARENAIATKDCAALGFPLERIGPVEATPPSSAGGSAPVRPRSPGAARAPRERS
jgi:lipopolysaccharide/colanic/teichoic acid biosynthesis glycosyltransferase